MSKRGKVGIANCWIEYPNKVEKFWEEEVAMAESDSGSGSVLPFAEVGFEAGMTKNLGISVGAVRWGVSLKMPCEVGEIDEVYDFTQNWVNDKMGAIKQEVES